MILCGEKFFFGDSNHVFSFILKLAIIRVTLDLVVLYKKFLAFFQQEIQVSLASFSV